MILIVVDCKITLRNQVHGKEREDLNDTIKPERIELENSLHPTASKNWDSFQIFMEHL